MPAMSSLERLDNYHLVTVLNEFGEEEQWLLTDHDRSVVSNRARRHVDRISKDGPIERNVSLFERLARLFRAR